MTTCVAVGDSITHGVGGVASFMADVASGWGLALDNRGVSGTLLQNGADAGGAPRGGNLLDNIEARSILPSGARLVCAYGLNDARYVGAPATLNAAAYKTGLRSAVRRWVVRYGRDNIWLVTPHWISDAGLMTGSAGFTGQTRAGYEAYVSACREVAAEFGVWLVDTYAAGCPATTLDNIHPDAPARDAMAALFSRATRAGAIPSGVTGGGAIMVGPNVEAWLVDDASETLLPEGVSVVAPGGCDVVWRDGGRWECASLDVVALPTALSLDAPPVAGVGFTAHDASANALTLSGASPRNHITWSAAGWPVGTRVRCTLVGDGARALLRLNAAADLWTTPGNQNLFDDDVEGVSVIDVLTNKTADYFGLLTTSPGYIAVTDFQVVTP